MTNAEMRVAIAKDVLDHLDNTNIRTGRYISTNCTPPLEANAQTHINALTANCRVCALGACLFSYVRLCNELTIEQTLDAFYANKPYGVDERCYDVSELPLKKYFTMEQLYAIEDAFECRSPYHLYEFRHKRRLELIMKHIIKDNGEVYFTENSLRELEKNETP